MALRNIRYVGLSTDPTPAGAKPAVWYYLDASEIGLDSPSETDVIVPSMLGMSPRNKRAGAYIPEGNIAYNTDIFSLGYPLKWGLMGYAFTAAEETVPGTPDDFQTHEIWANDVRYMQSLCAQIGKDEFEHVFRNVVIGTLEGTVDGEFLELSMDCTAGKDYEDTLKSITTDVVPKIPEEYALMYHDMNLYIDEAATVMQNVSDLAKNLSWTVENNTDAEAGITLGSRFTRRIPSSGRDISLSSELHFENMNQKRNFWGELNAGMGTPGKLGSKTFPVEVSIDSGAVFDDPDNFGSALIRFPKCYYNVVPTAPSGRDEMSNEVEMAVLEDVVTLEDAVTEVATAMYIKLNNRATTMTAAPVFPS